MGLATTAGSFNVMVIPGKKSTVPALACATAALTFSRVFRCLTIGDGSSGLYYYKISQYVLDMGVCHYASAITRFSGLALCGIQNMAPKAMALHAFIGVASSSVITLLNPRWVPSVAGNANTFGFAIICCILHL